MTRALVKQIPNTLTSLRLVLALTFFWIPPHLRLAAVGVALLSEYLDGALARKLDAESELGVFLDPIADKAFVLAVLMTLTWDGLLAPWELAFVGARDIIVAGAVVRFSFTQELHRIKGMRPAMPGKLATTLQFILLVALVAGYRWPALVYLTGALSLYAGIDYVRRGWKRA